MGEQGSRSTTGTRRAGERRQGDPAAAGPLAALIARLREDGGDVRAEDLADVLWLAAKVPGITGTPATLPVTDPPVTAEPADTGNGSSGQPQDTDRASEAAPGPPTAPLASLSVPRAATTGRAPGPDPGDGCGTTVHIPAPSTLPDPYALLRALRPLRRRTPVPGAVAQFDEFATAERAAESRLLLPVLRPADTSTHRIALLMDVSSSNAVWRDTFEDLRQAAAQAGVFRDVAHHYVHETPYGEPRLARTFAPGSPSLSGDRLLAPGGHRLVLVLSDCVGPLWRDGHMQRLLHRLARSGPVAVMQPLPQRMWARTHLPPEPGILTRRPGLSGTIGFHAHSAPAAERARPGRVPVPILAPRAEALAAWARLVADLTGGATPGVAGFVGADHPAAPAAPAAESPGAPVERVSRFRATGSPDAVRLATLLAAVPLAFPVMQLVQRALLPESGPDVMAEVVLSGLLRRVDNSASGAGAAVGHTSDGALEFAFRPGVREELLLRLSVEDAQDVLRQASAYVERRFGRGGRNFPVIASAALSDRVAPEHIHARTAGAAAADLDGGAPDAPLLQDFARVSAQVLRRFGAPAALADRAHESAAAAVPADMLAARARDRLDDFRRLGSLRHLDLAVTDLGAAVETEREPAARAGHHAELAEALLLRWSFRPLGEQLREALYAAQEAVPLVPSARLTLTRVLERMADEAVADRLDRDLLPRWALTMMDAQRVDGRTSSAEGSRIAAVLLAGAVDHLAGPAARADADDTLVRDLALARVRVLRRLAVIGAPFARERPGQWCAARLLEALDTADLLVAGGPVDGALVARGAVLFDLARHHSDAGLLPPGNGRPHDAATTADPAARRAHAVRAAADLGAAADEPSWGALHPAERCRCVLDRAHALVLAQAGPPDDAALEEIHTLLDEARRLAETPVADSRSADTPPDPAADAVPTARLAAAGPAAPGRILGGVGDAPLPGRARIVAECALRRALVLTDCCPPGPAGAFVRRQDDAIEAWADALSLLVRDDPRLPAARTSLGELLTARATRTGSVGDRGAAVRMLRRAVDVSAPHDPESAGRRLLLARSLLAFAETTDTSAPREADDILDAVQPDATPPAVDAAVWQLRGDLAARAGDPKRAARCYATAADRAWRHSPAPQWFQAAAAHADALEHLGDTVRALHVYEQLVRALHEGGAPDLCTAREADRVRAAATRLGAAPAADGGGP
ncbi:metallophosphoesterase [Streptomyces sp. p1417]|uniref:Metallophosphoesterase n=1 Tax=Streptomyces typhae TaxID=2681492 RepID=A0A6L6WRK5_9ACTN|nr:SAV_2336 N-terminal domain-related protein [Streptomyces typhae]MVO84912.1 metallophosphoesterase [Streptomyces typhae]